MRAFAMVARIDWVSVEIVWNLGGFGYRAKVFARAHESMMNNEVSGLIVKIFNEIEGNTIF